MTWSLCLLHRLQQLLYILLTLLGDIVRFVLLCFRPSTTLAADTLFLRKQLALYQERHLRSRRATIATCLTLIWLNRWFNWRQASAIVTPQPPPSLPAPLHTHRHLLPAHVRVVSQPILGGLHHAYDLAEKVA